MVQSARKTLTLDEFLQRSETEPATEFIDGELIQKPMPQGKHSKLQGRLTAAINAVAESQSRALALPELRCTFGDRSIIPDIAVFTWNRLPLDADGEVANTFTAAPDWAIEILSPEQNQTKVTSNILHCLKFGCQMGWLIDPAMKAVFVYPAQQQPEIFQLAQQQLPIPAFVGDWQLSVNELFAWLRPGSP